MTTHPQIQTFLDAAAALKEQRYWDHNPQERIEFLIALGDVLRECSYQLDRHQVLEPAAMEAFRAVATFHMPAVADASAEGILMGSLEHRIQLLREEACREEQRKNVRVVE